MILRRHGLPGSSFVISRVYSTFRPTFLRAMINGANVVLWSDKSVSRRFGTSAARFFRRKGNSLYRTLRVNPTVDDLFTNEKRIRLIFIETRS